MVCQQYKLEF